MRLTFFKFFFIEMHEKNDKFLQNKMNLSVSVASKQKAATQQWRVTC